MNSEKPKVKPSLIAANARVVANPTLAHMRKVAYTPSSFDFKKLSEEAEIAIINKAFDKRAKRAERNLRNVHK